MTQSWKKRINHGIPGRMILVSGRCAVLALRSVSSRISGERSIVIRSVSPKCSAQGHCRSSIERSINAGPTHPCNFHVVGEQFDTVYLGAPPTTPMRGVQTWDVPPGGGMCFELLCDVAGEFPFANHGFGHGQKGGVGFLVVEP